MIFKRKKWLNENNYNIIYADAEEIIEFRISNGTLIYLAHGRSEA